MTIRLKVKNQADRDQMTMILARNGYTVRQGKYKPPGAKTAVSTVEVVDYGPDGSTASSGDLQVVQAAKHSE